MNDHFDFVIWIVDNMRGLAYVVVQPIECTCLISGALSFLGLLWNRLGDVSSGIALTL